MTDVVFETPRLVVRSWTQAAQDVDFLFDLYSRWEVQRYLGAAPRVMDNREQAVAAAARLADHTPDHVFGSWAVTSRDDGRPLGAVLLKPLPFSPDVDPLPSEPDIEVGWHLHPDAWGHGYATEAARGALQRGFDAGIADIVAVTYAANVASQAVCRRLGMTHLGLSGRYYGITCELFTTSQLTTSGLTTARP